MRTLSLARSNTMKSWLLLPLLLWMPNVALADDPAPVAQHSEAVSDAAPAEEKVAWNASLGGVWSTGNTESWQLHAGSRLEAVTGPNVFLVELSLNWASAVAEDSTTGDYERTAESVVSRLRYDRFFTPMDAAFVALRYRRDVFAGLDSRAQGQVGYLRNVLKSDDLRFWLEIGYDVTYDNYYPNPLRDKDTMLILDGSAIVHSARAYMGYEHKFNDAVSFNTGLEGLLNVENANDWRLESITNLRAAIADHLQAEFKVTVDFDHEPVQGKRRTDTTSLVNLIFTLL